MKEQKVLYLFLVLIIVYAAVSLLLPSNPEVLAKYNLTQDKSRLLSLTIVLPLTAIWFTGFYGFSRIKKYAGTIKESNEGGAMNTIANGIMVQVLGLPVSAILAALLAYVAWKNPDLEPTATILRNYAAIVFPLMAFRTMAIGAEHLSRSVKHRPTINYKLWVYGFIGVAALYSWLVISQPQNSLTGNATYHLPGWLITLTLTIPYLIIWFMGAQAAYQINAYRQAVRGIIYKRGLRLLAAGITALVGLSIAVQLLTTISARLNRLELTPLLAIIYVLVLLYSVGYILIAMGAKKLIQIEEV